MADLKEVFTGMRDNVTAPPEMKGITAVYQFLLEGEDAGNYFIKFENGAGVIGEGEDPSPSITINMAAADFKDMVAGKLNSTMAFMSGKLKVTGDISLAMKLQALLG